VKHIIFACALSVVASAANAQEVVLTSNDGSISLRGQLLDFTDQKYTVDTLAGTMTLSSNDVECTGEACPVIQPPVSQLSIEGADTLASSLLASLMPAYAQSLDGQLSAGDDQDIATFTLADTEGEVVANGSLTDSSSTQSLSSLLQGQATIALTSRQILPEEASEFENNGLTIQSSENEQVIGLDAIALVTSPENPIDAISIRDAALVFTGAYSNWSELGGIDAPINLYGPPAGSELVDLFNAGVIKSQVNDLFQLSENIATNDNVATSVSNDPNGIGYTHFSKSSPAKTLAIREVCGITTPVNGFTIKSEQYPLTQRFFAYSTNQPEDTQIDGLLRFLQSDTGQAIADSHGLIDQRQISTSVFNQGMRFANAITASDTESSGELLKTMVAQIINSERLSATFRFETGSNQMDQRAKADVIRLAEKLSAQSSVGTKVHLLGFTDAVGDFELNQEVSLRRANQVRDALLEIDATLADQVSILPTGFGEVAPIACNETALGRSINRRVEVWLGNANEPPAQ